ncbi:hypothetical protein BGZ76_009594 [Entomortierella beljakovae]|nr:hypothetical protein BGZ76_009594 [Entomortierella beljakovae]
MAKGDSNKLSRQPSKESADEKYGYWSDTPVTRRSDSASQYSKDSTSSKKKGWTRSLKKATSSILYMAMPPTSADQMPMVVAQTPMSPDRIVPALHSPLLQAGSDGSTPSITSIAYSESKTTVISTRDGSFIPAVTPGSSSSSMTSSSTISQARQSRGTRNGNSSIGNSKSSSRKQRSTSAEPELKSRPVTKGKGKENDNRSIEPPPKQRNGNSAFPGPVEPISTSVPFLSSPSISPPPRSPARIRDGSFENGSPSIDRRPSLPSPPPSPMNITRRQPPPPRDLPPVNHEKQRTLPVIEHISSPSQPIHSIQSTQSNRPGHSSFEITTWNTTKKAEETKAKESNSASVGIETLPILLPNNFRLSLGLDSESENANSSGFHSLGQESANSSQGSFSEATLQKEAPKVEEKVAAAPSSAAIVPNPEQKLQRKVAATASSIPGSFPGLSYTALEIDSESDSESVNGVTVVAALPAPLPGSFPSLQKYKAPRPPRNNNSVSAPLPGSFPEPSTSEADLEFLPTEIDSKYKSVAPPTQSEPIEVSSKPKSSRPSISAVLPKIGENAPMTDFVPQVPKPASKLSESPIEESTSAATAVSTTTAAAISAPTATEWTDGKIAAHIATSRPNTRASPDTNSSSHLSKFKMASSELSLNSSTYKRSLPPSSKVSITSKSNQRTVKNAPWLWHQDGIHHQRLESHQILTKEQVFDQFHLDLEQDGPNGFFLFKLVKRFKKQDPSLLAISSSLLDAEMSASPSTSPPNSTPSSILESLEAVSVSQRLKRQLLLQKSKKQKKAVPAQSEDEDEGGLEALLSMTNNNTSLDNLNSSLQEVIDAVDSMKQGGQEWSSLLSHPRLSGVPSIPAQPEKPSYPDSDGEYTSRDKDAPDVSKLESRRGIYTSGKLDGMNLIPKKKYMAAQRRSSMPVSGRKGSISVNGADDGNDSKKGADHLSDISFKKAAVHQLHIYSRNGLKFKFDVMEDNELHFVEASKKYTFMDPLASHRQPDLDMSGNNNDSLSPVRSTFPQSPSGSRPTTSSIYSPTDFGRPPRRSSSTRSKSTMSSVSTTGSRRVYVTRLGRHTLLTYPEYKALAKSASSFTLGAKLLIQRSIAVATPNFYGSSSGKDSSSSLNYDPNAVGTPKSASNQASTPSGNGDNTDYFSLKKKPKAIAGFASKAVAAVKSPSSSNNQKNTSRSIVTPYNPDAYKNKSISLSNSTPASEESPSPLAERRGITYPSPVSVDSPDPSPFPMPPNHASSPSDSSMGVPTTPATPATPSTPSSSHSMYGSIKRQGNQAGIKFQHLFVTIHQRLQKLELDNGTSLYGSALVQWTLIEDPAELRWWRDKIGIQMIGRLDGDEIITSSGMRSSVVGTFSSGSRSTLSSVRASYMSSTSMLSDATSSSLSSRGYRTQVSVERLGYRFLRVSGHMGTMKVTVSEQVEARAVALAVRAEMIKQKRHAHMNHGYVGQVDEAILEHPWVEPEENTVTPDGDSDIYGYAGEDGDSSDMEEPENDKGIAIPHGNNFYNMYEYDEWTGRTTVKKEHSVDKFSRRKRHSRRAAKRQGPLIERMTMIVGQSKVFKGDWYMKNVYKYYPE